MPDHFQRKTTPSLTFMLASLTILFVFWQVSFFITHLSVDELINALTGASIVAQIFSPVILMPIFIYIVTLIGAYILFTRWVWFMAQSLGDVFALRSIHTYYLGISLWCIACLNLLALNHFYFPNSFFSGMIQNVGLIPDNSIWLLIVTASLLTLATCIAYFNFFWYGRHRRVGTLLLVIGMLFASASLYDTYFISPARHAAVTREPNIIIIGLDSLRPDFTRYFGNHTLNTPNIDAFLSSGFTFTNSYTPLARTYPSWVSILTAKHPLHNGARNNLINPAKPLAQDNLARHLQQAGYETIYASDEKRYSNITKNFGFDTLIGPEMGANDFLLGGLGDSPMSNLIASSAIGRHLLPYNYGNRAAAITYYPDQFMQQITVGLAHRSNKPLFLAVHFCLTHWPFIWASDQPSTTAIMPVQYRGSVEMVDRQLGLLMQLLQENGVLENSLVVLMSDHGTSIGLPGDRIISKQHYLGANNRLKFIPVSRYSTAPQYSSNINDYSINTAYGQGTSVLSLTQHHTLLAFKRYGGTLPPAKQHDVVTLMDIAPTILDFLHLSPLANVDGVSLNPYFSGHSAHAATPRKLFLETGDSFAEIETDQIRVNKVIKREIGIYEIDPTTGLLQMIKGASDGIAKNKQLAIIEGDWLLAHIPEAYNVRLAPSTSHKNQMVPERYLITDYYVISNLKTREWTIGLDTPFAKKAPTQALLQQLKEFYPGEIRELSKTSTS